MILNFMIECSDSLRYLYITLLCVDPMSNFLGFFESLEKNSSNGVIKSNI